jgi:hypothetical protein
MVEQPGQNRTIDIGERRPADLTLKHQQLMPQHQYLHLLLPLPHQQRAQQSKRVGGSKVDQAQYHERSSCRPPPPPNTQPGSQDSSGHGLDLAG